MKYVILNMFIFGVLQIESNELPVFKTQKLEVTQTQPHEDKPSLPKFTFFKKTIIKGFQMSINEVNCTTRTLEGHQISPDSLLCTPLHPF